METAALVQVPNIYCGKYDGFSTKIYSEIPTKL